MAGHDGWEIGATVRHDRGDGFSYCEKMECAALAIEAPSSKICRVPKEDKNQGGPAVKAVAPPGSFGHACYAVRENAGIKRSAFARKLEEDGKSCFPSMITFWEGGDREVSEEVAHRYGAALGLVPVLTFVTPAEAKRMAAAQEKKFRAHMTEAGATAAELDELLEASRKKARERVPSAILFG